MFVVFSHKGLGMKGDVLTVEKRLARSTLLPAGVAMYASPENLSTNEEESKVRISLMISLRLKGLFHPIHWINL